MPIYDSAAIRPEEYVEAFEKYIECGGQVSENGEDIFTALDTIIHDEDKTLSFSVDICLLSLLNFNQQLGTLLVHFPESILPFLNQALMNMQKRLVEKSPYLSSLKPYLFARLTGASMLGESVLKSSIGSLRGDDAGRLVAVRGTVVRTGQVKLLENARTYVCSKCHFKFKMYADLDLQMATLSPPSVCRSDGPKPCKSTLFSVIEVNEFSARPASSPSAVANDQCITRRMNARLEITRR
jgi:DNA helicase MCM9